mgnify:CR=1 FL=1
MKYTRVDKVEKDFKVDFGVRGDMKLSTYLKREGYKSLSKALEVIDKILYKGK